jgi:hypothetical protein
VSKTPTLCSIHSLTQVIVAEKTKRPLYRIGAQGTNVYSLTDTLSMASVLSKEYGAVLLLDGKKAI